MRAGPVGDPSAPTAITVDRVRVESITVGGVELKGVVADSLPVVSLKVGERSFDAHIDTGAPGWLTIPSNVRDKVALKSPARLVGHGRTVNSEFDVYRGTLTDDVPLGALRFKEATVAFMSMLDSTGNANLGTKFLRQFSITFDHKNERIRFVEPS